LDFSYARAGITIGRIIAPLGNWSGFGANAQEVALCSFPIRTGAGQP
jgi:hypothetical protein